MDGFERSLRAYNSMNAAYQGDETPNEVTKNQCVSIHAGNFLQRVASLNTQGRILLTTRLLPDDLKIKQSGNLLAGCEVHDLDKLSKEDAVAFFRKQNIKGTHTEIESACEVYGYHPLSLRLLAGRIVSDRSRDIKLAGSFKIDADLKGRQNHILKVAYESLPRPQRLLLSKIGAFRSPMDFEAISIFETKPNWLARLFYGSQEMQVVLNDFVARGLIHHDPNKDKYDLHPIVRRYAYDRLTVADRTSAHERLVNYFEAVPELEKVNMLEDLGPVIELYHHMVRAGKLDEACDLIYDRFADTIYYSFGAYQTYAELLSALFLDGEDKPPRLKEESAQAWTLSALANAYSASGQPRRTVPLLEMSIGLDEKHGDKKNLAIDLGTVARQQLIIGALENAERNLHRRIDLSREIEDENSEAIGCRELGSVLFFRGEWDDSEQELENAENLFGKKKYVQSLSVTWAYRALRFLLMARETVGSNQSPTVNPKSSIECAQRALDLADEDARTDAPTPRDYIRAYWLLGSAYRANRDLTQAEENLSKAISMCRQINLVDNEAHILLELAKLSFDYALRPAQGSAQDEKHFKDAREKAEEALTITERSGYVLQGADVNLFLAELAVRGYKLDSEKGMSGKEAALFYAKRAKDLAYCDGPPYYYKVAYEEAERLLEKLK
jgi:tetratricopeptide (TPR) repeat protein